MTDHHLTNPGVGTMNAASQSPLRRLLRALRSYAVLSTVLLSLHGALAAALDPVVTNLAAAPL